MRHNDQKETMKRIVFIFVMLGLIGIIGALHRAGLNLVEEGPTTRAFLLAVASPASAAKLDPLTK
jgi:hypothetical protein